MSNIIRLNSIKSALEKVFNAGYGHTIELKINGEYYEVTQ